MARNLGIRARITRDRHERRYRLWINNKRFVDFLVKIGVKDRSILCKKIIRKYSKFIIAGLFDAEGYIEFWRGRFIRLNFCNSDERIFEFYVRFFRENDIKVYVRYSSRCWRAQIYRKDDVLWFLENIPILYPMKRSLLRRKAET